MAASEIQTSGTGNSDTIQSLWIGSSLSKIEILSIRSFLANGHDYHLYVYSNVDGIPDGVTVKDANSLIPEEFVFRTRGSLSIFSDWFRQELLFTCGGYWADLDMVCLRPLRFEEPIVFAKQDSSRACNALLRFPKHHEVTRLLADVSRNPNTVMPYDKRGDKLRKRVRKYLLGNRRNAVMWGEPSGPRGLTKMLRYHGLLKLAKPFYYFYPMHYSCWTCAFDDTFRDDMDFLGASYCVHLWNEKMRRGGGIDKNGPFSPVSLVHHLMRRYDCC